MDFPNIYKKSQELYRSKELRLAGVYTFSNFFAKGLSFLLIPVFTNPKFLSPADNGLLNLYSQSVLFVLPFLSLGLIQTASIDYFTRNRTEFQNFCVTSLGICVVTSLISLAVFYLFGDLLMQALHFPPSFLWAIPLLAFLNFLFDFILVIIRNQQNARAYLKMSMTRVICELGLAVLLIVAFAWNWGGRVAGLLASTALTSGYGLWYLYKHGFLQGRFKVDILKTEIRFSLPIITMQISMFCLASSSTFILAASTGDTKLIGIFGLAMIFGSVVITFSHALLQYYIPKINYVLAQPGGNYRRLLNYFRRYILAIVGWFTVLLVIVPCIYYFLINPLYHSGIHYYFYISAGLLLWSATSFLYRLPLFYKQKRVLMILGMTSIIVSIGFGYLFVSLFGALGAAQAVLLSYLIVFLLTCFFTRGEIKKMFAAPAD